jgi:hypothetical protein
MADEYVLTHKLIFLKNKRAANVQNLIFIFSPKNLMLVDQNGNKKDSILNKFKFGTFAALLFFKNINLCVSTYSSAILLVFTKTLSCPLELKMPI